MTWATRYRVRTTKGGRVAYSPPLSRRPARKQARACRDFRWFGERAAAVYEHLQPESPLARCLPTTREN